MASDGTAAPDHIWDALWCACVEAGLEPETDHQHAAHIVTAFLRSLPAAWLREKYGLDEAVFVRLLAEETDRHG